MKILFICSANKQRSREDHLTEKYSNEEFLSAGTNRKICFQEGTEFITEELVQWADVIYLMEKKHKDFILKSVSSSATRKLKVLNIPDRFEYGQKELIALLEEKVKI